MSLLHLLINYSARTANAWKNNVKPQAVAPDPTMSTPGSSSRPYNGQHAQAGLHAVHARLCQDQVCPGSTPKQTNVVNVHSYYSIC